MSISDSPDAFFVGVSRQVWNEIILHLQVCHFSISKKLDIAVEHHKPIIYNFGLLPKVSQLAWETSNVGPDPFATRLCLSHECIKCWEADLRYNERQEVLVCTYCGETYAFQHQVAYRRSSRKLILPRPYSPNFEKRVVYFRTWLHRLQAKERNKITKDVISKIANLLKKENVQVISYWVVRYALQRLKLQRYYANTVSIMNQLRGTPLVRLTKSQEQILVALFLELKDVYNQADNERVNMLSYTYVIKKLCELKGWHKMAAVIPSLKSNSRIMYQDQTWKQVCCLKRWTFIPSAQWIKQDTHGLSDKPRL